MPATKFTKDDFDNLEMVRQIVFRRLKEDPDFNQFFSQWLDRSGRYVTFGEPETQVRQRFEFLADEVLWQLFVQRVITPGKDPANPDFPWFRLTGYGKEVLEADRFIPHDPTGYLSKVRQAAQSVVGQSSLAYLEESLRCFNSGCHVASVLLLGVAAEAVLISLYNVAKNSIYNQQERHEFEKLKWLKAKHRWLVGKYESIPPKDRRELLPESLDVTLSSLYDLIRKQRNELGHPSQRPPSVNRDAAFMYLRLFPTFIEDAEAFAEYANEPPRVCRRLFGLSHATLASSSDCA